MQKFFAYIEQQSRLCEKNDSIARELYSEYGVNNGLWDEKGKGILTGLTNISDIKAYQTQYLSQPMVEFDNSTYSSCTRADKDGKV